MTLTQAWARYCLRVVVEFGTFTEMFSSVSRRSVTNLILFDRAGEAGSMRPKGRSLKVGISSDILVSS